MPWIAVICYLLVAASEYLFVSYLLTSALKVFLRLASLLWMKSLSFSTLKTGLPVCVEQIKPLISIKSGTFFRLCSSMRCLFSSSSERWCGSSMSSTESAASSGGWKRFHNFNISSWNKSDMSLNVSDFQLQHETRPKAYDIRRSSCLALRQGPHQHQLKAASIYSR